jgi:putative phage-type endonuclease
MEAVVIGDRKNMSEEAWRELRQQGIGGSDAAAIAGLSRWGSAFSVYANKLGLIKDKEDNESMRQGRDLEKYVADRFVERMRENDNPKQVRCCNYILQSKKHPFMIANIDRLIVGEKAGLECKTTNVYNGTKFSEGDVQSDYYVQCQHYMAVTGAKKWYLAILVLGKGFYDFEIPRHDADIERLIEIEEYFWKENIIARIEPSPDGSACAADVIKGLYPEASEGSIIDLSPLDREIEGFQNEVRAIKEHEQARDLYKQKIQVYMKDSEIGVFGDQKIRWSMQNRKIIDSDFLKTNYPQVYESCLKNSQSRVFRIN